MAVAHIPIGLSTQYADILFGKVFMFVFWLPFASFVLIFFFFASVIFTHVFCLIAVLLPVSEQSVVGVIYIVPTPSLLDYSNVAILLE